MSEFDIFKQLNDAEIDRILGSLKRSEYTAGEFIFTTGDRADCLYILTNGLVKISYITADGNEKILDIFEPGDIFGELFLGKYRHRIGQAEAIKDVVVYRLFEDDLYNCINDFPRFGVNFIHHLVDEQREIFARMHALLRSDAKTRLLSTLLTLARHYSSSSDDEYTLDESITQEDIANISGLNRSTVSSLINRFRREGILGGSGRELIIDMEALERRLEDAGSEVLE